MQLTVLFPVLEDFVSLSMGMMVMLWFHLCFGSCEGDIYMLTGPELRNVPEVNAFQRSVGLLHSPRNGSLRLRHMNRSCQRQVLL